MARLSLLSQGAWELLQEHSREHGEVGTIWSSPLAQKARDMISAVPRGRDVSSRLLAVTPALLDVVAGAVREGESLSMPDALREDLSDFSVAGAVHPCIRGKNAATTVRKLARAADMHGCMQIFPELVVLLEEGNFLLKVGESTENRQQRRRSQQREEEEAEEAEDEAVAAAEPLQLQPLPNEPSAMSKVVEIAAELSVCRCDDFPMIVNTRLLPAVRAAAIQAETERTQLRRLLAQAIFERDTLARLVASQK